MNANDIVEIINNNELSSTAIIALIISFASLLISIVTVILSIHSHILKRRITFSDTFMNIITAQRNLFVNILGSAELKHTIIDDNSSDSAEDLVATFFINHAFGLFYYHKNKLINPKEWEKLNEELKSIFKMNFVLKRWKEKYIFYAEDFQQYVAGLIDEQVEYSLID